MGKPFWKNAWNATKFYEALKYAFLITVGMMVFITLTLGLISGAVTLFGPLVGVPVGILSVVFIVIFVAFYFLD